MHNPSDDRRSRLLTSPWVRSWIGRARKGERLTADGDKRAAAWAQWAAENLTEVESGKSHRSYPALWLDGSFYPPGDVPSVHPHLEVPTWMLERDDPQFPDRLAEAGNGLAFPWLRYGEVTALRRAVFTGPHGDVGEVVRRLRHHRDELIAMLEARLRAAGEVWDVVEEKLIHRSGELIDAATGDFDTIEVADAAPSLAGLGVHVRYDARLRDRSGTQAPRRLGVWQLRGTGDDGQEWALPVVTPRLTERSTFGSRSFGDATFAPESEAPSALLVRALLLGRVCDAASETPQESQAPPRLMAKVAQPHAELPEASMSSAVRFLRRYRDADAAWHALLGWAGERHTVLVREAEFKSAHERARRMVSRAEEPARDDVNTLLPLAWRDDNQLVRVTFSRLPHDTAN